MSKKVKNLIERDLKTRLDSIEGVAVINPRGVDATKNNQMRRRLRAKGLRVTVVRNSLAVRATKSSKIEGFAKLLDGPSAVVYGKKTSVSAVARALMEEKKLIEKLELRGLFFDGELFEGEKGVKQASELPTREEAIALIVAAALSPGRKLAGALKGPAGKVAALVKAIEEKAGKNEPAAASA